MSAKDLLNDPQKLEEVAKKVFKSIDSDGNGYIDFDELSESFADLSDEDVKTILKQLDADKSGKISYSEFKTNIKKIIDQLF